MALKYIEVRFLKPHPKYAYFSGDSGTVDIKDLFKMVRGGFVKANIKKTLQRDSSTFLKRLKSKRNH
jgi:hypothetical protein